MRFPSKVSWQQLLTTIALSLTLTVPFLVAYHVNPIPSFYPEWTAALFGLVAMTFLLQRAGTGHLELPELCFIPAGLLLVAALQWLILPDVLPASVALFSLYLCWTILMLILGRELTRSFGLDTIGRCVALAVLVGALLEALTACLQLEGSIGQPWIFSQSSGYGIRGNLAQRNNFCDYLWLGISAALYLRSREWLKTVAAGIGVFILISLTIFSGSRTIWLYSCAIPLLSIWAVRHQPEQKEMRRLLNWSIAALISAVAIQLLVSYVIPAQLATLPGSSAGSRLLATGGSDPVRLVLWRAALITWQEHPWLGAGIGQFKYQFYLHHLDPQLATLPELPENAHNLFFQLLAETGLLPQLLLLVLGLRWTLDMLRKTWSPAHWYFMASLLVLGLHSGLEYPLWYSYFLGSAALMAGSLSTRNLQLNLGRYTMPLVAGILLFGVFSLYIMQSDYTTLEEMEDSQITAKMVVDYRELYQEQAQSLFPSVFSPYYELFFADTQEDTPESLGIKLATCDRALRFSPSRLSVFKCAHLQAIAGKKDAAKLALQRAVAAFPDDAQELLPQWRKRATMEPGIALLLKNFPDTISTTTPH